MKLDKPKQNLKELDISLEALYNNEAQINIHLSDKTFSFYVILKDLRGKIDCKLSSYAANLWTRTNKGINYAKYNRLQDLQTALKREVSRKIDTEGDITFSLSSVIGYM